MFTCHFVITVVFNIIVIIIITVTDVLNRPKLEIWDRAQREAARGVRKQAFINF